jgi:hypothetical protein
MTLTSTLADSMTMSLTHWLESPDALPALQQEQERRKCQRMPAHFLERYCQVYDATARVWLPFGLWPAQRDVLIDLEQHRLTVILKARQLGLSWLVVGWALWLMLFQPAATVLFFSKRDQEAVHLLAFRLRGMLDRLPDWLRPELVADNDHNIELANGAVGLAFPTTGGRSYTASLVVVDEADFAGTSGADNLDALLAAVKPTIDAGDRLILLSTADKSKPQKWQHRMDKARLHPAALDAIMDAGCTLEGFAQQWAAAQTPLETNELLRLVLAGARIKEHSLTALVVKLAFYPRSDIGAAGTTGLEPAIFGLTGRHVNHYTTSPGAPAHCVVRSGQGYFYHTLGSSSNLTPLSTSRFSRLLWYTDRLSHLTQAAALPGADGREFGRKIPR